MKKFYKSNISNQLTPAIIVLKSKAYSGALPIIRSLGKKNVPVYIVGIGTDIRPLMISRYCTNYIKIEYNKNTSIVLKKIQQWYGSLCIDKKPILFFVEDEIAIWVAKYFNDLRKWCIPCAMDPKNVYEMIDKDKSDELARLKGLKVPNTTIAKNFEDIEYIIQNLNFPVIIKPATLKCKNKVGFKVLVFSDKKNFINAVRKWIDGETKIIVQEYIPGGDDAIEFYMFYRTKDGSTIYSCTGRKIRQYPMGNGIMASGVTEPILDLQELSDNFIKKIDARGYGGIEFKRYNGFLYFIEMSVRPETFHSIALKANVDLVWFAYKDLTKQEKVSQNFSLKKVTYINMVHYVLIIFKHKAFKLFLKDILYIFKYPVCFSMYMWNDPAPVMIKTMISIKNKIFRSH